MTHPIGKSLIINVRSIIVACQAEKLYLILLIYMDALLRTSAFYTA